MYGIELMMSEIQTKKLDNFSEEAYLHFSKNKDK